MNKYVATFFSHYDALTFYNAIKGKGIQVKLAPVPRKVSASCGTCVFFDADAVPDLGDSEVEAVYMEADGKFLEVWVSE